MTTAEENDRNEGAVAWLSMLRDAAADNPAGALQVLAQNTGACLQNAMREVVPTAETGRHTSAIRAAVRDLLSKTDHPSVGGTEPDVRQAQDLLLERIDALIAHVRTLEPSDLVKAAGRA